MREFLANEKSYILERAAYLIEIAPVDAAVKKEGKWSCKEIIGHLIDSASNNHQRFIRAQFTDDLIFPPYQQDEWVRAENYQNEDWNILIDLWRSYNLHIIHAVDNIPAGILTKIRAKHNPDIKQWKYIPASYKPAHDNFAVTLEYLIMDYFGHIHHHMKQLESVIKAIR